MAKKKQTRSRKTPTRARKSPATIRRRSAGSGSVPQLLRELRYVVTALDSSAPDIQEVLAEFREHLLRAIETLEEMPGGTPQDGTG